MPASVGRPRPGGEDDRAARRSSSPLSRTTPVARSPTVATDSTRRGSRRRGLARARRAGRRRAGGCRSSGRSTTHRPAASVRAHHRLAGRAAHCEVSIVEVSPSLVWNACRSTQHRAVTGIARDDQRALPPQPDDLSARGLELGDEVGVAAQRLHRETPAAAISPYVTSLTGASMPAAAREAACGRCRVDDGDVQTTLSQPPRGGQADESAADDGSVDCSRAHRWPPAPFAGMTRIRFNGRWQRHPLSPRGLPCSAQSTPAGMRVLSYAAVVELERPCDRLAHPPRPLGADRGAADQAA